MARRAKPKAPAVCPVCNEPVPRGSLACPNCGADHNSGWRENADTYDALDLPDDNFDYDEFVREEFGSRLKPARLKAIWWIAGIVLIVALALAYFYGAR